MSLLTASLYLLCLAFLFGSAVYVYSRDPFARLNAAFALLALTLLGWVGTLFLYTAQTEGAGLLWLGRANFAAAALMAPAAFGFVVVLARRPLPHAALLWGETLLLFLVSLFTGAVDRAELVQAGQHVSVYGTLFLLYLLHIVFFVVAALLVALRPARLLPALTRTQLRLVGTGILATAVVGLAANIALPYWYGDFRFIHVGTLSTIFFLAAVAYAAVSYRLFDLRLLVRATLLYALLIAFALELYQLAVEFLTRLLPLGDAGERHVAAAFVALTINAFTHEPLRRWLERLADRLTRERHKDAHVRRRPGSSR